MIIYQVYYDADLNEGRGQMQLFGTFAMLKDAEKAVQLTPKVQGCAFTGEVRNVEVFESFEAWHKGKTEAIRQSALHKLTKEEKIALGLKW